MVVNGSYKPVLLVPTMHNLGGYCDIKEIACQKRAQEENYESDLIITPDSNRSLRVNQTFTAAVAIPPASWTIDASGTATQTAGGKPDPGSNAKERATLPNRAFDQGHGDRVTYEVWFSTLQGEARAGAESWAERRSLRTPGTCEPPSGQSPLWSTGCNAARQMLAPFDARRRTEPDYRRGWNSF